MTQAATLAQLASSGAISADTSGNVGIGTTTPSGKLDVLGAAGALTNGIIRSSDGNMSRLTLSNTNRNWTISNYGTQFAPNGSFNIADETAGLVRFTLDTSGNMYFNSGYGSNAVAYGCRAWVNFNGTGTVAIRASGNVSSITDVGVGYYRVNFATAMPDVNYVIANNASDDAVAATITCTSGTWGGTNQTTTSALIFVGVTGAGNDRTYVGVSILR